MVSCPALLVAGCASGQGKTTVTAGLARLYRRRGLKVRVFKTGPDFLDPLILERAAGSPAYQLDLWMVGAEQGRALLHEAAQQADLLRRGRPCRRCWRAGVSPWPATPPSASSTRPISTCCARWGRN